MDGIPSGLSSITPILPETPLTAGRGNSEGPPVEILPVPKDSFNGDGSKAEMQNSSFSLGRNGTANDDKAVGRMPPAVIGGGTPDAEQAGALLGEAYTLSLGADGEAPVPPEMARELSRMRNYEQLGRAARPAYRRNLDTGAVERVPLGQETDETAALLSGKLHGYLSQSAAEQSIGDAPGAPARETAARPGANQSMTLTISDYEAILSLEPDLQEALLRLLEGENISIKPQNQTESAALPAGGAQITSDGAAAPGAAAGVKAAGTQSALDAGMANLRKITELPYALYLFGALDAGSSAGAEEDLAPEPVERETVRRERTSEFLRRSEAVKMAAVLHSIYHGGSGSFPRETPWYAPYVRYAVTHGIIRSGDFGDLGDFATRSEAAYIFSGSVPKAEFPVINYAPRLEDVDEDTGYGAYVYLLCRAGILKAGDSSGRFYPHSLITRTEAAAAIGRIATPPDRMRA